MSTRITASNVVKIFDKGNVVIPDLSLDIHQGELFTLLGPSGCGKTTLLRMIAGFYQLDGGHIHFNDTLIDQTPAYARNIGMVFQNYAIFPHMTVAQNVEYGLKQHKVPKAEREKRVKEMLEVVRMAEYADRLPSKLSGGQQQRIALARAIVIRPDVLLMDEPLSNLDAKLRVEMRSTIREIQRKIGITTVYVTHDQEEALAISDRIAIMNHGVVQQVAHPQDIYQYPANVFVSTFIGFSNLFKGCIRVKDGKTFVQIGPCTLPAPRLRPDVTDGQQVIVSMRGDEFSTVAEGGIPCKVKAATFLGQHMNYSISFPGDTVVETEAGNELTQSIRHSHSTFHEGDTMQILPDMETVSVFTADGSLRLSLGGESQ